MTRTRVYSDTQKVRKDEVNRGEIWLVDFGATDGSEQGGLRPAVIIQNNVGNIYSPTTIVATITSKIKKPNMPTHVLVDEKCGLDRMSQVETEQIATIDKKKLHKYIGRISSDMMASIDIAVLKSIVPDMCKTLKAS